MKGDADRPLPIRVVDLETAGPAATDVCEIGWQDVALGEDRVWRLAGEPQARFVNPGRPITADTMAIHHIQDAWVGGAPYWAEAAPGVLRPVGGGVRALAAHRAAFEQRYCTPKLTGSVAWICTWKCALRLWPTLPRFSNQMLRYLRRPVGLEHEKGLPAHRAGPDAYVTAHHLRDMLNLVPLDRLIAWSAEPGLLPRVPSGRDRGRPWSALDEADLRIWSKDRDEAARFSAETELRRRDGEAVYNPARPDQGVLF